MNCNDTEPCLIILPQEQTFTPNTLNREVFGIADLTYKINGTSSGTGNYVPEFVNGASCYISIKGYESSETDPNFGYEASVNKLVPSDNSTPVYVDTDQNGTADSIKVNYSKTNGCEVKLPANNQVIALWAVRAKIVNPGSPINYMTVPAYFFSYGALGQVEITATPINP